ncbi:hypothetical protein AMELA_G00093430 [Ameiurus melas]|uniref:Chromo domain-containing protein n=1 Tax=Ameiurus melas TaxID=219545 RepID=A0A7J6AX94_AMEME|nr:hypothetical protein AMELA_G00093430 [Ameiurus melas]
MDSGADRADPGDSEQDEEEDVYEVERIIDMRVEEGEVLYRVRWKNYSSDDDTWEPKAHLEDCSEVLLAYERTLAERKLKKDASMKKKKKKKHSEESDDEKDRKKKKKKERLKEDKPLPAPESDEEEDRVSTPPPPPPSKKEKATDIKKRAIEKEEEDEDDAPAKKHKKESKAKDLGKQKRDSVDEKKKKKVKSTKKKEIETSDDETDKSDAPSELFTDDTSSTGNLSITAKTTTPKSAEKSTRSESGSEHPKAKQKKSKPDPKLQSFKDLSQDKNPKKTDSSALLLKESGLNKLKSLASSKSSSKSSRSEDEPDSSDAAPTARAKPKPKGPDSSSTPPKDSSVSSSSSSSTVLTASSKPREEELKETKEEAGEKGVPPNNLFEKFLLNCEAKDRVPRKSATHTTPKSSVKTDKKVKKESPVQKPEFDKAEKAKEGITAIETEERQEKSTQDSEKSERSNELVAKTKEDLQREQKEEEQRRRKERLEEEEKKRKERLEESQRERKARMEEAQRERQRLAEEARLDRLDRRPVMETMASAESTEDSRWKERRRKRREEGESRLLIACDDNQDSQDPLERSDKTPDRGPPSLNLGVELKLDWMTLEDFQKHLNGEDENLSPLALTPTELRDAVKNGNYMAVKRALGSKEDYNLDQEDSSGMSLSMLAAAGGQDDILRLLIKRGVKVNGRQKNGTTALMHAAEKNFLTTVAVLLEAGSCLNAQTAGGETALMKACRRGNADVVRLLLEYGADCNILSKHKTTALHFAKLSNNMMVFDLIKDHIQTYKPPQHTPGEGSGILLFIFHANFMTEITARLCGPCSVHAVILNDKFQLPIFLDSHFIYSFSPVQGANKLFIRLAESPTAKVKLLIGAYRVQLQ